MKASIGAFVAFLYVALGPSPGAASPVIPGLASKHSLSEAQVGELLMGELRCAACHGFKGALAPVERTAPDLSDVGSRIAPDYLQRFIASPSNARHGATMPDVLSHEPADRRDQIAEAIAHFLISQSPRKLQIGTSDEKSASSGKAIFHSVGCIACHSPRDEAGNEVLREGVVDLGHVSAKFSQASLEEFLFQPLKARPSGRMPDMKLTPTEAHALSRYLRGKADAPAKPVEPRKDLVNAGRKHFQELNCAACHKLGDVSAAPVVGDLRAAKLDRGCLADGTGKSPRFHLSAVQQKAIRAALARPAESVADKTTLAVTLTAYNCIACHVRGDAGGVSEERNLFFQSEAKNLGDDGRLPPPLTHVGAKLKLVALKKVLFDGESVRPYMATRMPQYGEPNVRRLPDLFARLDKVEEVTFSLPNGESPNKKERERAQEMREAGRKLLGNKSLNCVACHDFNGKTPQNHGVELMTSFQRLQPSWFYRFLADPNAFRPRTVMPTSWPGGKGIDDSVFNGDAHRQIEAIWYFLSLGRSAPDPSGVQSPETKIVVTDATRTYRGRSSVAGYRGIAVGFPEKLSYAFNAETGTLSAIWRGDFVRVDRGGQGSGGFHPGSRPATLAQDVSFFALENEQAPWPLRPVMTKDNRVNPDPLYPKNRGYQFKGYYLDDASITTFLYRSGDIEIEDRSIADASASKARLIRSFSFESPKLQTTWFRALVGRIEAESKQRFRNADLALSIPPVPTLIRPAPNDNGVCELLLKLEIPQGKSKLTLTYELLK